jgi:RNA polymerase sigma factor (sigma-70 family)
MREDRTVAALVTRAAKGDQCAWDEIVERYAPLVWSICRRYRLERTSTDEVGQNVWLRLVELLPVFREPAELPGWLAATTQQECLRVLRLDQQIGPSGKRPAGGAMMPAQSVVIEDEIIAAAWSHALCMTFAQLPLPCRQLLSMLMQEPPPPDAEISERLGIPVGGIATNRAQCLARMRRCAPLAPLLAAGQARRGGGLGG